MLFSFLTVFTIALILLAFPAGVYAYYFTQLSTNYTAASPIQGVYLFLGPAVILVPLQTTFGAVFAFLTLVYAAMVILAAFQGRGVVSALRAAFKEGFRAFFSNTLLAATVGIGFLVFTDVLFTEAIAAGGAPVGSISGDAFQLFSSLAIAPLREELGFRVVMIGLFAVVACVGLPRTAILKSLWRPSVVLEAKPGDRATTLLIAFGLVISSITFGVVHVISDSGWEIGKLPVAAYAGFVLGYLYIRYGFHVAVLGHWGVDYLTSVFSSLGQGAPAGSWISNAGYFLNDAMILDLTELFGVACFILVVYMGVQWFRKRREERRQAPSVVAPTLPI